VASRQQQGGSLKNKMRQL